MEACTAGPRPRPRPDVGVPPPPPPVQPPPPTTAPSPALPTSQRSKTRVLTKVPTKPEDLPVWNYDGSSTGQVCHRRTGPTLGRWVEGRGAAWYNHHRLLPEKHRCGASPAMRPPTAPIPGISPASPTQPTNHHHPSAPPRLPQAPGDDSEVYLVPRSIFKDPFRKGDNIIVMCDAYEPPRSLPDGTVTAMVPLPTNTRAACAEVMAKAEAEEPWFGIEQEYSLMNARTKWPLGWPTNGYPGPQGPYYCSGACQACLPRAPPCAVRTGLPGGLSCLSCSPGPPPPPLSPPRTHRPPTHPPHPTPALPCRSRCGCRHWARAGGGAPQGLPVRGRQHQRRQRRGHALAVGVPGGPLHRHHHGRPPVDEPLPHVPPGG